MKISECKSSVCRTCGLDPKFFPQVPQRYKWVIDRKITCSSVLHFGCRIPVTLETSIKYTKIEVKSVIEIRVSSLKVVKFTWNIIFPLLPGRIELLLGVDAQVVLLGLGLNQMVLVKFQVSDLL